MTIYQNPILYADYSDPDVIRVGKDYYMVASSFTYFPGVPLLHSLDLVHWEIINYCVPALPFDKYRVPNHGSGIWAPSIRYYDSTFFVFIPLVDEGIMVARSKDPYGEFELNMLWEGKGWIDPCPLWDDDGRVYMIFAYANSRCGIKHRLSVVEIDSECRRILSEPRDIFDGVQIAPTTEGPKFYKKDGCYYVLMPSGGVTEGWQSCLRAENIYGPYEYKVVMHQGNTDVNDPHQGGWVTTPDGKDWFIHFQDVVELGRITHLQPMCFCDGWPFIGQDQNGDGIGEPVTSWVIPEEDMPRYEIVQSDDFASEILGLQWQWQANPNLSNYSLAANPGHLRLYCRRNEDRENLLWYASNALTQIPQKKALTMTSRLMLGPGEIGDFGGIGMIGHVYAYIGLYRTIDGFEVRCYQGTVIQKEFQGKAREKCRYKCRVSKETEGNSPEVWFRLEMSADKMYSLSYSLDGECYTMAVDNLPLRQATWTGAKLCLWACAKENAVSAGFCDYESIMIL